MAGDVTESTYGAWTFRCEQPKNAEQSNCIILQNLVLQAGGHTVLQLSIGIPPNDGMPTVLISLPLGISLPPGISIRIDSGDPAAGAETAIDWWKARGEDPTQKLVIFSDGLDVDKIVELHHQFQGRVRASFGWGTLLTNDFRGLVPGDRLAPFSLVCKAVSANGRPTVKLSDNPEKAMGPADEIARYKRVFDVGAQERMDVIV